MSRNDFNNINFINGTGCANCRFPSNPCPPTPCQPTLCPPRTCICPTGPQGIPGPTGPTGATGAAGSTILGTYTTYAQFIAEHPRGTAGEAYLVSGRLYVWNTATNSWQDIGSLVGPTGATEPVIIGNCKTARYKGKNKII